MSLMHLNNDGAKFPEPLKFIPERWLNKEGRLPELYAFGKGTRMCVGIKYVWSHDMKFSYMKR